MPRPSLGGPKWPYPRRLATHLKTEANNGSEQIGEKGPWLPFDERFNFTKKTDFDSGTVSAAVPAIFSGIGHLTEVLLGGPLLGLPGLGSRLQNYQSFQDVAEHYSYVRMQSMRSAAAAVTRLVWVWVWVGDPHLECRLNLTTMCSCLTPISPKMFLVVVVLACFTVSCPRMHCPAPWPLTTLRQQHQQHHHHHHQQSALPRRM